MQQQQKVLVNIDASFKKIIIVKVDINLWRNEDGILIISLEEFLLNSNLYRGDLKVNIKAINDISIVNSNEIIIKDTQTAIDFIMSVKYETNCSKIAINKGAIIEDFFILSKGIAGEILQKFINYQIKFAIIGDYSKYTSKPLKDFIYESNKGKDIFFVSSENEAIEMLSKE